MKTITFKPSSDGKGIVVGNGEATPAQPTQQWGVPHVSPVNPKWVRRIEVNQEFIFLKRYGCPVVGMKIEDFVSLAIAVEPLLSFAPVFTRFPQSGFAPASLSVEFISELSPATYQWQSSADGKTWADIPNQTSATLEVTQSGQYRCVATNAVGSTSTDPAIIAVETPKTP
jgi:hypothetical protein